MADDPTEDTEVLKLRQEERAAAAQADADAAAEPAEQHAHERRAEKAEYLRDKLAEAEEAASRR